MTDHEISKVLESILKEVTEGHRDIFHTALPIDERLQLLTTESLLALTFVTAVEDEFSIEFDDDEVDIEFFNNIESLTRKIRKYFTN